MSAENKQQWDFIQMVRGNSTLTIFVLSGFITLLAIVLFYNLNESSQRKATAALLDQTVRQSAITNINHAIKDKVQDAFNNYLLFADNKKETQRIEAVYAAKSARGLLDEYKTNVISAYGPDAAKQEFDQLVGPFAEFEETILGDLEEKAAETEVVEVVPEPVAEEIVTDMAIEAAPEDTTAAFSFDAPETPSSLPPPVTLVVNKKTALASLHDINSQLFSIENRLDMLGKERIELLAHNSYTLSYMVFGGAIMLIFGFSWLIIQQRQKHSIYAISDALKHIAKGERPDSQIYYENSFASIVGANDELIKYLDNASLFAKNIGEGNFDFDFRLKSENDALGNSLIEMRNRLQEVTKEDKIRNWTNEGQAKFGELLRLHSDDLEKLGSQVLSNLIEYLNASQGALFVLNEEGEKHLELLASYANKRKKFINKRILPGEGLAGQVFEEGKTAYITDIRTDHYNIETGLGESRPSSILIVPLKEENKVEGVLEIASLNKLQKHEIAFVEAIGRSIASSFNSGKINETTKRLLEETQEKAEQMKAQEEELRQNMEELAATQEQIERRNHEMEEIQNQLSEERYLLSALLKDSKDHIYFKDRDSKFIRVSQSMVKLFNKQDETEILGKSDFDFGFGEHAQVAFDDEQRIIRTGRPMEDVIEIEKWDDGRVTWVSTTKNPLRDLNGQIVGTFGISRDVTHSKRDEVALKKSKNWLENFFKFHPTGFMVMDQNGKINYITDALVPKSGLSGDTKFEDIFTGIDFPAFLDAISFEYKKDEGIDIALTRRGKISEIPFIAISGSQENEDGTVNIYLIQK